MAYPEPPSTPDSADALVAGVQSDPDVWLLYCAVGGRAQEEICAGGKTRGPTRHFFHGHTHTIIKSFACITSPYVALLALNCAVQCVPQRKDD
jgi:hypothetical protein